MLKQQTISSITPFLIRRLLFFKGIMLKKLRERCIVKNGRQRTYRIFGSSKVNHLFKDYFLFADGLRDDDYVTFLKRVTTEHSRGIYAIAISSGD